ncbi:uncharacterized protein [Lepeophtheirus salmonis]|uniref:Uncharacterized protein n=1 Tax=Lepeophtheirus salmonis TaxID=72036 RepID=A0A0K2UN24_LEPSM|nr:uncharacterized protein LOC121128116 [Lepeophtheirus salmonis]
MALVSLFVSTLFLLQLAAGDSCYFPVPFQGEFLTQSLTSRDIAYTSVSILFDSIPTWGTCHRRIGHHVILQSSSNSTSVRHGSSSSRRRRRRRGNQSSSTHCFKCISLVPRSENVLHVHTHSLDICYSSEKEALDSCPSASDIRHRSATEIMLYKTRGFYGKSAITKTYCPLNGRYRFTYSINDGTEDELECNESLSTAGDCPSGYKFDLHFKGCSFPDLEMSFQCLASWEGENGDTYLSLLDTKLPQLGEEPRPRYRCGIFKEDPVSGQTHLALSSDSTCVHHLYSSQDGYETLHLSRIMDNDADTTGVLLPSSPECTFPSWIQGKWNGIEVKGGRFTYRDEENFVTYRGTCLSYSEHQFSVALETDCGQTFYACVDFAQRDTNVMEFRLGKTRGGTCTLPDKRLTFGRLNPSRPFLCPLKGEFTGVIPDAEGLCAKSYADCSNPEIMFHTVFNCYNVTEIYEQREYRCFGQWEEDGLVYTYTERLDLPGTECFVGVHIDDDRNVVTEAGSNCERGHQPMKYGMTLNRQRKCPSSQEETILRDLIRQEGRLDSSPTPRNVSPKLSTVFSVVIKPDEDYDHNNNVFSANEIPGSSGRSSGGSPSGINSTNPPFLLLIVMTISLLISGQHPSL